MGAFYDHLNALMSAAQSVLAEGNPGAAEDLTTDQVALKVRLLQQIALGTFIRGLPTDIAKAIVIKGCTTLEWAYEEAVRYECKMDAKLIPDTLYRSRFDNPYAWGEPEARQAERWVPRQPRYDGQNQGRGYDRYNGDSRYVGQIHTDDGEHEDRGYVYPEYPVEDHGEYPNYFEQEKIPGGPYVGQIQRENYELRRDNKDWQRPNVQEVQPPRKPINGMPYQGAAANDGVPYQGPRPNSPPKITGKTGEVITIIIDNLTRNLGYLTPMREETIGSSEGDMIMDHTHPRMLGTNNTKPCSNSGRTVCHAEALHIRQTTTRNHRVPRRAKRCILW